MTRASGYRTCLLLLTLLVTAGTGAAESCQPETSEFDAMHRTEVVIRSAAGREVRIAARVADETLERAAGYQHICPRTIDNSTILFLFPRVVRSAFHMNNVHAPLDIAFIGEDGRINEIQRMQPYVLASRSRPLYQPRQPFLAALEARAGFFSDNGVAVGDMLVNLP